MCDYIKFHQCCKLGKKFRKMFHDSWGANNFRLNCICYRLKSSCCAHKTLGLAQKSIMHMAGRNTNTFESKVVKLVIYCRTNGQSWQFNQDSRKQKSFLVSCQSRRSFKDQSNGFLNPIYYLTFCVCCTVYMKIKYITGKYTGFYVVFFYSP